MNKKISKSTKETTSKSSKSLKKKTSQKPVTESKKKTSTTPVTESKKKTSQKLVTEIKKKTSTKPVAEDKPKVNEDRIFYCPKCKCKVEVKPRTIEFIEKNADNSEKRTVNLLQGVHNTCNTKCTKIVSNSNVKKFKKKYSK